VMLLQSLIAWLIVILFAFLFLRQTHLTNHSV